MAEIVKVEGSNPDFPYCDMVIRSEKRSSPIEDTLFPKKNKIWIEVNDYPSISAEGTEGVKGKITVTFFK